MSNYFNDSIFDDLMDETMACMCHIESAAAYIPMRKYMTALQDGAFTQGEDNIGKDLEETAYSEVLQVAYHRVHDVVGEVGKPDKPYTVANRFLLWNPEAAENTLRILNMIFGPENIKYTTWLDHYPTPANLTTEEELPMVGLDIKTSFVDIFTKEKLDEIWVGEPANQRAVKMMVLHSICNKVRLLIKYLEAMEGDLSRKHQVGGESLLEFLRLRVNPRCTAVITMTLALENYIRLVEKAGFDKENTMIGNVEAEWKLALSRQNGIMSQTERPVILTEMIDSYGKWLEYLTLSI